MSTPLRLTPHERQQSSLIVELTREAAEDQFSCTLTHWNFLRDLAKTFGWRPVGTTYLPQRGERARPAPIIKHDYHPGDSQDRKRVGADDSSHWAAALDRARRSPFISGMLQARAQVPDMDDTEQSLRLLIQEYINFARRGAFVIALRREQ
jgi:hypothetical protein